MTAEVTGKEFRAAVRGRTASPTATLAVACLLSAASGMAGLAHQLIWTRRLVDLLGASPVTFSKVIGAFFLGLAAGSAVAAMQSGRVRRPWRWVAGIEFSVAVLALPILLSSRWADWFYQSVGLVPWLKFMVPFVFVTPPAIAMGLATPFLVRALTAAGPATNRGVLWIYAVNILGGVAGIALVLVFALPRFGLTGAGLIVCALNVLVGVGAFWQSVVAAKISPDPSLQPAAKFIARKNEEKIRSTWLPVLAFCSGFFVLSLEVILQHQFAQVTINSFFSSGTGACVGIGLLGPGFGADTMAGAHCEPHQTIARNPTVGGGLLRGATIHFHIDAQRRGNVSVRTRAGRLHVRRRDARVLLALPGVHCGRSAVSISFE